MNGKPCTVTKEQIEALYIRDGKSSIETASILGCGKSSILRMMKRLGIERRTVSQALTGKILPPEVCKKVSDRAKERQQGANHSCWKGGRLVVTRGYILIWKKGHPAASRKGYVMEHRLIMEEIVGRYLTDEEEVHHKNFIHGDNAPDNLQLFPNHAEHMKAHKGNLKTHQRHLITS